MSPTDTRPRDPQRAARIVAAARALSRERGVGAITHRAVAERAGVPLGSTTYYFATIEDLLAQAIRLDIAEFRQRCAAVLVGTAGQDPVARILGIIKRENADPVDLGAGYDLYLTALARPALRPMAIAWGDALVEVLATFLTNDQAVAIAMFLEGHGIRATLLGRSVMPTDPEVLQRQLAGLLTG